MKIIFNYFILLCASSILLFSSCNDTKKADTGTSSSDSLQSIGLGTDTTTMILDETEMAVSQMPFVQKNYSKSVDEVYTSIKSAIEANKNLKISAEINHSEAAKGVEIEILESRLIIFGNPKLIKANFLHHFRSVVLYSIPLE